MAISKDEIYSRLFQKILNGEYPVNTRLKEAELAEEFGVSRTPVREVLMQLAQDGLIIIHPNRGATVQPLTPDDIEEIYEIRKSLELLALAFSIQRINLNDLRTIRQHISAVMESGDYQAAMDSDKDLHRYIVESSDKQRLINMVNQMLRIMEKFRYLGFHEPNILQRVCNEHIDLIDALTRRDLPAARKVLEEHLENSKLSALQVIFTRGTS